MAKINFQNGKAFTDRMIAWQISKGDRITVSVRHQQKLAELTQKVAVLEKLKVESALDKNQLDSEIADRKKQIEEENDAYQKSLADTRFEYSDAEKHIADMIRGESGKGKNKKEEQYTKAQISAELAHWMIGFGVEVPLDYDFGALIGACGGLRASSNRVLVNTGKNVVARTQTDVLKVMFGYIRDFMMPKAIAKYVFDADIVKFYAPRKRKTEVVEVRPSAPKAEVA